MTFFLAGEWIPGMAIGIEFRHRAVVLQLLIVRLAMGWMRDDGE